MDSESTPVNIFEVSRERCDNHYPHPARVARPLPWGAGVQAGVEECRTWPCFSQGCGQPYIGSPEGTVAELEAVVARLQVDITTQQSLMIAVRDKANDLDEKS